MIFMNNQRGETNNSSSWSNANNQKSQSKLSTSKKQQLTNKQLQRQLKQIISSLQSSQLNNLFKCFQIQNNSVAIRNFNRSKIKCIECQLIYHLKSESSHIDYLQNNGMRSVVAKGFGRDQLVAQINAMRNLLQTFVSKGVKIESILKALRSSKYKQPLIKSYKQQQKNKLNYAINPNSIQKNQFNGNAKSFSTKKKTQNYNNYNYNKVVKNTEQKQRENKQNIFNQNQIIKNIGQKNKQTKKLTYQDIFQVQIQQDKNNLITNQQEQQFLNDQQNLENNTLILDDIDCFSQMKQLQSSKVHQINENQTLNSQAIQFDLANKCIDKQQTQQTFNYDKETKLNNNQIHEKVEEDNFYKQINNQNIKQIKNLMARIKLLEEQNTILKELLLKQSKYFGKQKGQH